MVLVYHVAPAFTNQTKTEAGVIHCFDALLVAHSCNKPDAFSFSRGDF
jgi:hypothetical protein